MFTWSRLQPFAAVVVPCVCFLVLAGSPCCDATRHLVHHKGRRRIGGHNNFRPHDEASTKRKTIANMTCSFVEQPLNHFSLPRDSLGTFLQRYCVNNDYVVNPANATVLFYTGNESPLEEYINNTGLMWELAQTFHAQIVFIEHRYEGQSRPPADIANCMAYSSSIQALADYASFIEHHLFSVIPADGSTTKQTTKTTTTTTRPVIAFGGSYGGMLTAWLRMKYPNLVAGAIAGSAPIWGFPTNFVDKIDAAPQVVYRGLQQPYPPTKAVAAGDDDDEEETTSTEEEETGESSNNNHCASNLLATWPLIQYLGSTGSEEGLTLLTDSFRLCTPLQQEDVQQLMSWGQAPWFDLAEGSFPYPSSYIPFALTHNERAVLPAWPLQAACWKYSELHQDLGVRFEGNRSDVRYTIHYGANDDDAENGRRLALKVDWETVTNANGNDDSDIMSLLGDPDQKALLARLLSNVRDAVSIWYNITSDKTCYDLAPAPNNAADSVSGPTTNPGEDFLRVQEMKENTRFERRSLSAPLSGPYYDDYPPNATQDCRDKMEQFGSWGALCCNEEMNLIITEAHGLGHDFIWPPSHPRGTRTHADVIQADDYSNATFAYCRDPAGRYGFPKTPPDPWSTWYDTVYGGTRIQSHSNIIFSNGLLDPWSAAGVYAVDPTTSSTNTQHPLRGKDNDDLVVPGLYLQHINDRDLIALIMKYGGHHTDLMYSSSKDPPSIQKAREIESRYIAKWIDQWWQEYG